MTTRRALIRAVPITTLLAWPARAATADIQAAFVAAIGHKAPYVHEVQQPIYDISRPSRPDHYVTIRLSAEPDLLVRLADGRTALIIQETNPNAGHVTAGAYSIAYLERSPQGWKLGHLWPEIHYSGVFGRPGQAGEEVHRYRGRTFFFDRDEWCGMGECSDGWSVIELAAAAPRPLDDIEGGGRFPAEPAKTLDPADAELGVGTYDTRAEIGPPRTRAGLFSVTYSGWSAPPAHLFPKTPFQRTTDYVFHGGLHMHPAIAIPDWNR